jgi:hypothetical protein
MKTNTIYFSSGEPGVEVLRLSKDGIWANPDIPADDAAKFVLNALGHNIKVLVEKAVEDEREIWERRCERLQSLMDIRETQPNKPCCLAEREACAKVCEDAPEPDGADLAEHIRARGQA